MQVGSLVECVSDSFTLPNPDKNVKLPVAGSIYTVREIHTAARNILLEEIVNDQSWCLHMVFKTISFQEPAFSITRFREIQPPISLEFIEEMQHSLTPVNDQPCKIQ